MDGENQSACFEQQEVSPKEALKRSVIAFFQLRNRLLAPSPKGTSSPERTELQTLVVSMMKTITEIVSRFADVTDLPPKRNEKPEDEDCNADLRTRYLESQILMLSQKNLQMESQISSLIGYIYGVKDDVPSVLDADRILLKFSSADVLRYEEIMKEQQSAIQLYQDQISLLQTKLQERIAELDEKEVELSRAHAEVRSLKDEINHLETNLTEIEARYGSTILEDEKLKADYHREYMKRRRLHDELIELKGNIRVYCRVRPTMPFEIESGDYKDVMTYVSESELVVTNEFIPHKYEFENVFSPEMEQDRVFAEVDPFIVSVLDGFNVCIFAYGQTGSGKTYTMEGPPNNRGVNYRALERLFQVMSVLEIYNETVRDLIQATGKPMKIRQNRDETVYVENLEEVIVTNYDDVISVLERASKYRATSSHLMNQHSSRSHCVLTVKVTASMPQKVVNGMLNLIDLAGSERVAKTETTGDELREAQNINKSLSALGDVISARANRSKHVPYRNSKLTYLLTNSLSNNSKIIMFVNVSPAHWNIAETISSLNFAQRCRRTEWGAAERHVQITPFSFAESTLQVGHATSVSTTGPHTTPTGTDPTAFPPAMQVLGRMKNTKFGSTRF